MFYFVKGAYVDVNEDNNISVNIIGVDPGVTGALALIRDGKLVALFDMPTLDLPGKKKLAYDSDGLPVERVGVKHEIDGQGVRRVLANWRDHVKAPCTVFIERMWSRPGQSTVSMDALLWGVGLVEGVAIGVGFKVVRTAPASWKAKMGVSTDKQTSLDMVRKIVQDDVKWRSAFLRKKDNGRAEAALIGFYGWREENE